MDTLIFSRCCSSLAERERGSTGPTVEELCLWFTFLDQTLRGGLKSIRFLEVEDYETKRYYRAILPDLTEETQGAAQGLQLFGGLRRLHLPTVMWGSPPKSPAFLWTHRFVLDRFQEYRAGIEGFELPWFITFQGKLEGDKPFTIVPEQNGCHWKFPEDWFEL